MVNRLVLSMIRPADFHTPRAVKNCVNLLRRTRDGGGIANVCLNSLDIKGRQRLGMPR
jgi:hypothetical protein